MRLLTIIAGFVNIGLIGIIYISINEDNSSVKSAPKTAPKTAPITELWKVISIADGDTIAVAKDRETRRVRFCGIDAPETAHKSGEISQPGSEKAKEVLEEIISQSNGEVSIAFIEQDRYGRWIGEIFANPGSDREVFVNEELVKMGLVWPYKQYWGNCPNRDAIATAESIAVNPIWEQPGNIPPWEWRQKSRP